MADREYAEARAGHLATRSAAGLVDFSFMGHFEVSGPRARAFLERLQTRNLAQLAAGRICYTLLLRDDGSVFNDATLWCLALERYWLFTGRPGDVDWIQACQSAEESMLELLSGQFYIIALQGPRAFDMVRSVLAGPPRYFAFTRAEVAGVPAWIARLGYSGEQGVEILVPDAAGAAAWQALMQPGVCACSFETADSLRIGSGSRIVRACRSTIRRACCRGSLPRSCGVRSTTARIAAIAVSIPRNARSPKAHRCPRAV